jgi:hypothetical protein
MANQPKMMMIEPVIQINIHKLYQIIKQILTKKNKQKITYFLLTQTFLRDFSINESYYTKTKIKTVNSST